MRKPICDLVAERVRARRTELEMPRRVLAEKTDISERYLAQLEAGKANVSIILLERIAKGLGVDMVSLLER